MISLPLNPEHPKALNILLPINTVLYHQFSFHFIPFILTQDKETYLIWYSVEWWASFSYMHFLIYFAITL
jgi:hypothetical protein